MNDLYLKYVNKVGKTLEKDRYFQYLFELVQAGSNVLQQKNQVLHKVVDERWLTTIEESLDAINAIIEKPRRFVTTTEEVVPVALARKITQDSVRHLSMNTQFIASDEDGDIQPTRILDVKMEESYDLYENRFIYHLIQRLVTFIDKRTDVIFWSTGDEIRNTLSYQSKVDDAYEEIEYKIEMTVKNRQSFAENDSDNMQVFMRIDRVRRLVLAMRNSAFCSIMNGCAKVRSPIQRTNLMMKDPDYRTCYKLWRFLESYEEVGYTIDVRDTALEFDEEYLFQLYTNLITNYTVFKSILEDTPRNLEEVSAKRHKVIKPKFIKKIEEQIVDNYDIPDVEVRQVIIEEVTQAQLDAEAKLAEETEARQNTQEALESLESQMASLQRQLLSAMEMSTAAEEEAESLRHEMENMQQQTERIRREKDAALAQVQKEIYEKETSQKAAQEELFEKERELKEAKDLADEIRSKAREEMAVVSKQADEAIQTAWDEAEVEMKSTKAKADEEVHTIQEKAQEEIRVAQEKAQKEIRAAQEEADRYRIRAEEEARAREKAQEKADANSLSKYIVTVLNNRRQKNDNDADHSGE
jgi:hypothetical protein